MKDKIYTILVTSDRQGKTKCFTLPSKWLRAIVFFSFLSFILLFTALVDYAGLLFESQVNRKLYLENEKLKHQFEIVDSKLQSLERGLERVRSFSTKLKLVTNVDDQDRVIQLAIGGPATPLGNYENRDLHLNENIEALKKTHPIKESLNENKNGLEFHFPAQEKSFIDDKMSVKASYNTYATAEKSQKNNNQYAMLSFRIDKATLEAEWQEQNVLKLWERLSNRRSLLKATPSIMPVRGWVTSDFGYRVDPFLQKSVMHNGMDIAARLGSKIRAPADGVVTFVGNGNSSGKVVVIDHGYGVQTRYAHNSVNKVDVGDSIRRGQVIALVGNTGRSTGPHVHYEVHVNGVPVNPRNYILEI